MCTAISARRQEQQQQYGENQLCGLLVKLGHVHVRKAVPIVHDHDEPERRRHVLSEVTRNARLCGLRRGLFVLGCVRERPTDSFFSYHVAQSRLRPGLYSG